MIESKLKEWSTEHSLTINTSADSKEGVSVMKQLSQAMTGAGSMVLVLLVFIAAGCQQPDPSLKLKPLGDKYAEVWNTGKVADLDAIIDPHFVRHVNLQPDAEGVEALKNVISGFRASYPDFKLVLNEEIYSENKSTSRWTVTGTNTGTGEMPPTGKSIKIWGTSTLHYANGMISEEWVAFDNQSLMQQLGFTMTPPAAAKP